MHLFYSKLISGKFHQLPAEESKHCIKVLRLGQGDTVHLTDGNGSLFKTVIIEDNFKSCKLEIVETQHEYGKRNFNLHLAVAPTKNINRYEWFLEKATEIGIDTITPVICDHSERRSVQPDRLNKIIVSAMKQSLKAYLPKLNDAITFRKFISQEFSAEKYIAYCGEEYKMLLRDDYKIGKDAVILIGPEGDFSPAEVEVAIQKGFKPVSLGEARLRTETAALIACATCNIINQ
jgi:16S rRNA (uracil1498-N3)-methyltransferase